MSCCCGCQQKSFQCGCCGQGGSNSSSSTSGHVVVVPPGFQGKDKHFKDDFFCKDDFDCRKEDKKDKKDCARGELIVNGGFETGSLNPRWTSTGTVTVETTPTVNPHEGFYLAILGTSSSITQTVASGLCEGKVYRLSLNTSSPGTLNNSTTNVIVDFINENGAAIGSPQLFTIAPASQDTNSDGGWNFHQLITNEAPIGTVGATVTIETLGDGSGINVDTVSFVLEN